MTEMRIPLGTALLAALIVAASVAALPVGVGSQETPAETNRTSGEALAGALAAQGSQLEGNLDRRELSAALERADGPEATAKLLSERRIAAERRAETLAERRGRLRAERGDGDLTAGAYRVERTRLAAEADRVRSILAAIARESRRLPPALRSAYGLDEPALNRSRARTAAAAPDDPLVVGANATGLDPGAVRNATARAVAGVETQQAELSAILDERDDAAADCGRPKLAASADATDRARSALERGESAAAESALVEARTALRAAARCLDEGDAEFDGDYELNGAEWNESRWDEEWNDTEFDDDRSTPTPDGSWNEKDDYETPTSDGYRTETESGSYGTETKGDYDSN